MAASARESGFRSAWLDTPVAFKAGVVVAIVAFLVRGGTLTTTTVNGAVTACSYSDLLKIGAAILLGVLIVQGVLAIRRSSRKPPTWLTTIFVLLLLGLAVILALRGLGWVGGPCQAL